MHEMLSFRGEQRNINVRKILVASHNLSLLLSLSFSSLFLNTLHLSNNAHFLSKHLSPSNLINYILCTHFLTRTSLTQAPLSRLRNFSSSFSFFYTLLFGIFPHKQINAFDSFACVLLIFFPSSLFLS